MPAAGSLNSKVNVDSLANPPDDFTLPFFMVKLRPLPVAV
jgi:hypothetical protein